MHRTPRLATGGPAKDDGPKRTLTEENEQLRQLAEVVFQLSSTATNGGTRGPVLYRFLADNLYEVWKKHAVTLVPFGNITDEIARELGYAAMAVYGYERSRHERDAFVKIAHGIAVVFMGGKGKHQPP